MESLTSLFQVSGEKENRLVQAVEQNNVELLKDLLDSPKWYNTTDSKFGFNLLQIAIFLKSKEVFDYLLSLPDYPLEFENLVRETALEVSLNSTVVMREYFACELIKKGACIDKISTRYSTVGDTFLHLACKIGFVKASMLLIEKGIDVNALGYKNYTPLQMICKEKGGDMYSKLNDTEIILMLLEFGADPSVTDHDGSTPFEDSVINDLPNEVQEALFYYTFDEFSLLEIHFDILLKLATLNSPLFYEITKHQCEIIIGTNKSTVDLFFENLISMNLTDLETLITKFGTFFKNFFAELSGVNFKLDLSIDKLNMLIESSLKDQIINFVVPLVNSYFYTPICYQRKSELELIDYICYEYLLSYGKEMDENTLYFFYERFGYCDLFKTLLHMDIKKENYFYPSFIFPRLLLNITENLEDILNNTNDLPADKLRELMSYFAHPKLHSMYRKLIPGENINVPQVPLLLELARNVFRRYFIDKFQIKTSRTFYTLLNCLKISPVHKRIITYETKLYSV